MLKAYAVKEANPAVDFETFVAYMERYAGAKPESVTEIAAELGPEFSSKIASALQEMQETGYCKLQKTQSKIHVIYVMSYYADAAEERFSRVILRGETPLPGLDFLGPSINPEILTPVNVKTDFSVYLEKEPSAVPELLNITFPHISKTLICTSKLLEKPLIEASLQKVKQYLRDQKNSTYMRQKMLPLYPQRGEALKNNIGNIVTKTDMAMQDFMFPSDETFQFWTQLTSMIIKDYVPKTEKTEAEIDLCLASYILNFYAVYFKGKTQKAKDSDKYLKMLAQKFTKSPFSYTFHDIYNFTDTNGFPLLKYIDKDVFSVFLESATTSKDTVSLPEILRVKLPDKSEYFIRSDCVAKLLLPRIYFISKDCKMNLGADWTDSLMDGKKLPEMLDDQKFAKELEGRVKNIDPLFYSLLNFSLLFLIRDQLPLPPVEADFVNGLLDVKTRGLAPMNVILGLSRRDILTEAKLRLPLWRVIPVLGPILEFFVSLFSKKGAAKPSPAKKTQSAAAEGASSAAEKDRKLRQDLFQEEVKGLISKYIGDKDLQTELTALVGLWNTLLEEKDKNNLVEDVNALVRDFLRQRKYKTKLQVPPAGQLDSLAEELSQNNALAAIKDKPHLRQYIILYMLKVLYKV
jgi:hypothetical protein